MPIQRICRGESIKEVFQIKETIYFCVAQPVAQLVAFKN